MSIYKRITDAWYTLMAWYVSKPKPSNTALPQPISDVHTPAKTYYALAPLPTDNAPYATPPSLRKPYAGMLDARLFAQAQPPKNTQEILANLRLEACLQKYSAPRRSVSLAQVEPPKTDAEKIAYAHLEALLERLKAKH